MATSRNILTPLILTPLILAMALGCGIENRSPVETSPTNTQRIARGNTPASDAKVLQEPSLNGDPEKNFAWFVDRYLTELPKLESTPYRDDANNRDERAAYEPKSHEIEFQHSNALDSPHVGVLKAKINSMEVYDGKRIQAFSTDFKFRFINEEGRWELDSAEMFDPTFEMWEDLSDLAWEAPLFEAARKVYED